MDNDLPEDDKTVLGGSALPQSPPQTDAPTGSELPDDDPFLTDAPVSLPPEDAAVEPEHEDGEIPTDSGDASVTVPPVSEVEEPVLETAAEGGDALGEESTEDPEITQPPQHAVDQTADDPLQVDAEGESAAPIDDDRTLVATEAPKSAAVDDDATAISSVPPPAPKPDAASLSIGSDQAVPVGTMINNNYEIKELISAGGMGEVFRGANAFTGDAVAIKIVLQSLANDPKIASLFMREAKVLCGLSDQAIVRYYNFVKDAELDRFCLIMEFIDGVSLSDFVRDERPLTSEEARDLMRKVARGLERAHQMEVVHRDLSPDNVMLRDGAVTKPVLIDFGIAKSTEMAESTLHGQLAGKFKYISPEQLGHFGGEIGPRTDIYGLALLIAAALRGSPLDMGSSVVEAVNARREIPDLSDIPEDMQPILAHMLEPDPADRPGHMADVIRLLDDPSQIPAKYGSSGVWDVSQTSDRTVIAEAPSAPPMTAAPAGLRQPPGATAPGTSSGLSLVPGQPGDSTSASPFGAATGVPPGQLAGGTTAVPGLSQPPTTAVPTTMAPTSSTARRKKRRSEGGGIGGAFRWLLILAVIGGLGGYVAYTQGLLPEEWVGAVATTGETESGGETGEPVAQTADGPVTRRSFLAGYQAGECSFADRVAAGPNTGTIEGFRNREGAFAGLQDAFAEVFDSRPAVEERIVTDNQCAVLDLARNLQRTDGVSPILTLDSDEMTSGGSIVGRLRDRRGKPVWLVLVTTAGGVYNLSDRLTEQADGSATFSFGLTASGSGAAEPQLIMAVVSDSPLIAAAAATNGARASSLLPLIENEITAKDGEAGVSVAFFDLKP